MSSIERTYSFQNPQRTTYPLNMPLYGGSPAYETNGQLVLPSGQFTPNDKIAYIRSSIPQADVDELAVMLHVRDEALQLLTDREYTPSVQNFSDKDILGLLGFTEIVHTDYGEEAKFTGPVLDLTWGFVELEHVPVLEKMLWQNKKRAQTVLDVGAGLHGVRKMRLEYVTEECTYVDNEAANLDALQAYLEQHGLPGVRREFLEADKAELRDVFDSDAVGAILRLGVFETSDEEMAGCADILTKDGALFVSNSLERQPIGPFLDATEPYFASINAYIGLSRYALVCQRPTKT